jgi:hypothetical protein
MLTLHSPTMHPIQRISLVSCLALIAVAGFRGPASAQAVYGRVLSAEQREMLPGAHVALLDSETAALVITAVTDSAGTFTLEVPAPGTYTLVASREGYASIPPKLVTVDQAALERVDVELARLDILTSRNESARRLAESAERACEGRLNQRSSAIMGVVRDSLAGVTLAGVPVVLEQVTNDGRLRRVRETKTDRDGFFAFCPLPAPREVAVRAELGDRSATAGIETEPGTGSFLNLYVGLATEAEASAIVGTVREWETGQPLAGSNVRLRGADRSVTTDVEGRFVFPDVPYGVYVVEVDHLGYSTAREAFYLNGGSTANVEVALSVEAIEIDPIVVTVDRGNQIFGDLADFERRMSRGLGIFLTAPELERQGVGPGTPLYVALRGLPSVRIQTRGLSGYSINLRSAFTLSEGTCEPVLYVDGMRYQLDPDLGWGEPIGAIQAIEIYRGAAEVPGEFSGSDASCGVVVVWTKRGR